MISLSSVCPLWNDVCDAAPLKKTVIVDTTKFPQKRELVYEWYANIFGPKSRHLILCGSNVTVQKHRTLWLDFWRYYRESGQNVTRLTFTNTIIEVFEDGGLFNAILLFNSLGSIVEPAKLYKTMTRIDFVNVTIKLVYWVHAASEWKYDKVFIPHAKIDLTTTPMGYEERRLWVHEVLDANAERPSKLEEQRVLEELKIVGQNKACMVRQLLFW